MPRSGATVDAGPQAIAGVAWQPTLGIAKVEVQVDEGPWTEATLGDVTSGNTWVQWYLPWDATSGEHRIQVRATNTAGETQTEERADPAPDGATGWHSRVTVERPLTRRRSAVDPGAVLAWGAPRLRDLPWRATRDPWRILVAEIMLQQTQVPRVIPTWLAFCDAYPTPAACAAAPLGDVLRRWQGLGYPRRARNLHDAAGLMVDRHGGRVPDDLDALRALPGIGPYTARAVLAFAYERDVAVVDTNIARVLARVAGERLTLRRVQDAADALVPAGAGWAWNQMLMDLGATVCRPAPRCADCPLAPSCAWHVAGHPEPRSGRRLGRRQHPPGAVRGQRPPGPRRRAAGPARRPATGVDAFDPRIVAGLVADRLVARTGEHLHLP